MKAMILAAGYGTRLEPLTLKRPKALMPVANIPVVDRVIAYLKRNGVREIIVNAHHLHHQVTSHLAGRTHFGLPIHVEVEDEILGTGGGIKNVEEFWDCEPFLVINADILTDIDLRKPVERHRQSGAMATLVIHDYPLFNLVRINSEGHVEAFLSETQPGLLAFTGIHILSRSVLDYIPPNTFYSIIDAYRDIIHDKEIVASYMASGHYWRDIGTIDSYVQANIDMIGTEEILIAQGAVAHPASHLGGWCVVGHGCSIGEGSLVENSILWDGAKIGKEATVVNSIVTQDVGDGVEIRDQVF
ncbi:MAG: hypothetical protein DRH12_09625 [Deltaproteobacteria bacterium]|nr:MAG: hypothetical protein DRH12_09625 [Deltaproteobacteria bacterium]